MQRYCFFLTYASPRAFFTIFLHFWLSSFVTDSRCRRITASLALPLSIPPLRRFLSRFARTIISPLASGVFSCIRPSLADRKRRPARFGLNAECSRLFTSGGIPVWLFSGRRSLRGISSRPLCSLCRMSSGVLCPLARHLMPFFIFLIPKFGNVIFLLYLCTEFESTPTLKTKVIDYPL